MTNGSLTVGEVAALTGRSPGSLRQAERRGRFPPVGRGHNGWRTYDAPALYAVLAWSLKRRA